MKKTVLLATMLLFASLGCQKTPEPSQDQGTNKQEPVVNKGEPSKALAAESDPKKAATDDKNKASMPEQPEQKMAEPDNKKPGAEAADKPLQKAEKTDKEVPEVKTPDNPLSLESIAKDPVAAAKVWSEAYLKDLAEREGAANRAYWEAARSGKTEDFDKYAAADLALRSMHSDAERYAQLEAILKHGDKLDPMTRRSLNLAALVFKGNLLPQDLLEKMVKKSSVIEQAFKTYRGKVDGKEYSNNELLDMLAKETDSGKRQAIWEGLKEVGSIVGADLVELAKIRNEAAVKLGFKNFWDMQIRLQEHDPDMLVALFAELDKATTEPFAKMKATLDGELSEKLGVAPEAMMPWHYDNPFFQDAPPSKKVNLDIFYSHMKKEDVVALGNRFYAEIGLPLDDISANSDFYERPGKDQHAFCITLDRMGDVRMLLNVTPTAEWMDTMLHESGHAVYYKYIDRSLPFNMREAAHIFTTEAVAMMFGAMAKTPSWIQAYAGADPEKVKSLAPAVSEQRQREQLIFTRWTLVMFNFEKALYENPDQDLNTLWWDNVEKYQMLKRPQNRNKSDWASKPHFSMSPVYYHNYMLGELFAAQIRSTLMAQAGKAGEPFEFTPEVKALTGPFFVERIFKPGMTLPWPEFVKAATGSELGIAAYAVEVSRVY